MSYQHSYVTYIKLPSTKVLPVPSLVAMYSLTLVIDYLLVRNEKRLSSIIPPFLLRSLIGVYHFILPLYFDSKYEIANISFMLQPWIYAIQIFFLTESGISLREWIPMMIKIGTFQDETPNTLSNNDVRLGGMKKLLRGTAKLVFMRLVLDQFLPKDLSIILHYPVYNPKAMFLTYVLAMRIYCMMSLVDVLMGLLQIVFLVRFQDLFDNPFMSSSPKDFWNRRWNRAVSRMFNRFIFSRAMTSKKKKEMKEDSKERSSLLSSPLICGLVVFFISGIFHDFMIGAATRVITLEMTVFFMIHGFAVALETTLLKRINLPNGLVFRAACHVFTTLFFIVTGRLFLNPILQSPIFLSNLIKIGSV